MNKSNYYIENITIKETLHNQQLIIAKMEKEIINKNRTIDYLSLQLTSHQTNNSVNDLICFD